MAEKKQKTSKIGDAEFAEIKEQLKKISDKLYFLYPGRCTKPPMIKAALTNANSTLELTSTNQITREKFKTALKDVNEAYDQEIKKREEQAKIAEENAEKSAKEDEKAAKHPEKISDNFLAKLAQKMPDPKTKVNHWRPKWAIYDFDNNKWKISANILADEIADNELIYRVEEKGKVTGYVKYNHKLGQWEQIAPDDLGNFVDLYFKYPAHYSAKDKYKDVKEIKQRDALIQREEQEHPQYADDLHTAKALNDTLRLLKSKVHKIDPTTTFDEPPKFIVHCKTFDFDVYHWKKLPFSPIHYFVSGLEFDPDATMLTVYNANQKSKKGIPENKIIKGIAPQVQKWLYLSLGEDKESLKAYLERLGLSMLHTYDDLGFIVFLHSQTAGIGKSKNFKYIGSLFQKSDVNALDLDTLASKGSFDAQELRYHDINLTGEVKTKFLSDQVMNLLELLSGGDARQFPQKFLGTADFINHSHLWFNMNHLPRLNSYDEAVARRMDIIEWYQIKDFQKKFSEAELNRERPELILLAMIYAHKCLHREPQSFDYFKAQIRLTRSKKMIQSYKDWAQTNDYFANFIAEKCSFDPSYKIGVGYLLKQFNEYLENEGERVHYYSNDLKDLLAGIGIYRSNKTTGFPTNDGYKKGVFVYKGITLNVIAGQTDEAKNFDQMQKRAGKRRINAMYSRDQKRYKAMNRDEQNG